jgi:uncharacterized radical SAM superfamily Fe-S cluster-containing enzyme
MKERKPLENITNQLGSNPPKIKREESLPMSKIISGDKREKKVVSARNFFDFDENLKSLQRVLELSPAAL